MIIYTVIVTIICLIIWIVASTSKWRWLHRLDADYIYSDCSRTVRADARLSYHYDKVKDSTPTSETLYKIQQLILKSILELAEAYKEDNNRDYVSDQYIERNKLIRSQAAEYYGLLKKNKIKNLKELDALVLTLSSYKEACEILDRK